MLKKKLETLLLLSANSIKLNKFKKFFKEKPEKLIEILLELKSDYEKAEHGIMLLVNEHSDILENEYQFVSIPENKEMVKKFFSLQDGVELTKTAIETLTIIAYRGPVKRTELEYIRGVNSRQILNQLLSRDLVIEVEDDVFEVSVKFLKLLGLKTLKDLDNYENLHNLSLLEENRKTSNENETEADSQTE